MKTVEIRLNNKEKIILLAVPATAKNFTLINSHTYFHSPRIEHSVGGVDLPYDKKYMIFTLLGSYSPLEKKIDFPAQEEWMEKDAVNQLFLIQNSAHTTDSWVNSEGALGSITRTEYGLIEPAFISLLQAETEKHFEGEEMPQKFVVLKMK